MHINRLVTGRALGTLFLVLGCAGSETPAEPAQSASPSRDFTNGPASPGPVVFRLREPDWFVFLFPDLDANLTASVGFVDRFSVYCDPAPISIPPEDLQFLFSPTGRLAVLVKGREMPVIIYSGAISGSLEDYCAQLATAPIIARGTAHFVFNNKDLLTQASNGYRAEGTVELTAGGQAHFSGVVKFVTTPDGVTRILVSQVTLGPAK
jgi:hypothetical protein